MNMPDKHRTAGQQLLCLLVAALVATIGRPEQAQAAASEAALRQRMIVLTDIEADPDDTQSLVRLLLYANVIDLEGLVATTSTHKRTSIAPESIHALIDTYGKVHAQPADARPDYPRPPRSRRWSRRSRRIRRGRSR